ncbi:MAG: lectin-like protein [Luteolibacter sp.]|uniref:lectin-like protein n=1 Tax=Luteolibacter sp. TaxID=1962973 RepID=UPI00326458E0
MTSRILISVLALSGVSPAGEIYTAPFGAGGTWNIYQLVGSFSTWDEAKRLAEEMKAPAGDPSLAGHLVTLSSIAENQFVREVANRQSVWCGLTDDERFGGHEAGAHPRDGWKWITGEPLTFSNWKPSEPDDWSAAGEDAVFIERYGHWCDTGNGVGQQAPTNLGFVVEWETRSPKPVEGAIALQKTWPEGVVMPPRVSGKWNATWKYASENSISRAARSLNGKADADPFADPAADASPNESTACLLQPWLWTSTPDVNRQGWLMSDGAAQLGNFPDFPRSSPFIAAVVGKIHVETAGTYTLAVSAEDAFALRIGGLKWKAAHGDGFIDPLDPLTLTQPNGNFSTKALGVIDLPAGDHIVEGMWMTQTAGSEFHVLSAAGVYETEGATTDWRPLGHVPSAEPVPALGLTAAGWTVDASLPREKKKGEQEMSLQSGLMELELDLGCVSVSGLPSLNFSDAPEVNTTHFPAALPFPNQKGKPKGGDWPLRAKARLVVPKTGLYQIGIHAAGQAALRINGGEIAGVAQDAQGNRDFHLKSDSFDFNGRTNTNFEPKIVTTWMLEEGEHDIEVFYVKQLGPGSLAVFSSPVGPYGPGLLAAGGAKLAKDLPGLPHAR